MPDLVRGRDRLHYEIHAGPAQAAPVLLLHGLGSCAEDWLLQVPPLTQRFAVVAPDLRGHGASGGAGWPTMADHARDAAGLLAHLGMQAAHVVGLSLGGAVGLQLALDAPRAVRSLVLVNTFARWRAGPGGRSKAAQRTLLALTGRMDLNARQIAAGLFPREEQAFLRRAAEGRLAGNSSRSYFCNLVCVARFDVHRRLGEIDCPVLVVAGDRDATVPMRLKVELAQGIPRARLEVIRGSGHATPIDAADVFNRLLLDFLGRVDPPAHGLV